jgi:hypothetical protein
MGPRTHAAWLGSTVFDGALRYADFQGADEIFSTGNSPRSLR